MCDHGNDGRVAAQSAAPACQYLTRWCAGLPIEARELLPGWWQGQLQQLDAPQGAVGQQLQQAVVAASDAQHKHQG